MGETAPIVQKIKNLVYTSNVTDGDTQSTEENLAVFIYSNYLYEKQNHIQTINYYYATNMCKTTDLRCHVIINSFEMNVMISLIYSI